MASWKKLINSGSNAHVESLEILSPPTLSPSLEVDGGVFFPNLPDQDDLPGGTLMKIDDGGLGSAIENIGNSKFVIISNTPIEEPPPEDVVEDFYQIPWNSAGFDFNNDGEIGSADLLGFLIAYGEAVGEPGYQGNSFNFNNDAEIGSADLLGFLIAYGEPLADLDDTRPSVNWNSSDFEWIDDDENSDTYGYVTKDSVIAYYDTFTDPFAIDGFWSKLGYDPEIDEENDIESDDNTSAYRHIYNSNPPAYNVDTFPYEYIDIFIYIYFTQTDGGGNPPDGINVTKWGGSKYYNRDGAVSTYFPDGAPIGYGPYS